MKWIKWIAGLWLVLIMFSCANRAAGPTGGPRDSIPPVVLRSVPVNGAINYKKKEILVYFDENVTLDKVTDNFIISPPQQVQPVLKANARVLSVILEDELMDSTTYSLFFGNAIVDLNEKNPLENYQFAFSTGNEIDTLQVGGRLYDAWTLDPVQGIFVGLHRHEKDSALYTDKFIRVTKTDEEGRFLIRNVKAGTYSVYALGDSNRDFMYQPGEAVSFFESTVVPEVNVKQRNDTLWKDSVTIDTVRVIRNVTYSPDTLILRLFKEKLKRQYLVKSERKEPYSFSLFFNRPSDSLPQLTPLNFEPTTTLLLQKNSTLDSLSWWIPDSAVYGRDTLSMTVKYLKTDSLFQLVEQLDTLSLVYRKPQVSKKETKTVVKPLVVSTNISSVFDLNAKIRLQFAVPVSSVDTSKIALSMKKDSLTTPVPFTWQAIDSIGLQFQLDNSWEEGESYELKIDSAAFVSLYHNTNVEFKSGFKTKTAEDYSTLKILLEPFDSLAVLQLIDSKETVIQQQLAKVKGNMFQYVKPGDYFVKLFVDANRNGMWDTGELLNKKFPEQVLYFTKKLTLKANWELEETWNISPVENPYSKPDDLVKKPKKQ
jgi:uncharacterized protein (DUF2141 family)